MSDRMTDPFGDLEQELSRLLEDRASSLESRVPPIAALAEQGESAARRQRRVRTWSAVGAAAAVAVIAVAVPLSVSAHRTEDGPAPATHSRTPSPDASRTPTTASTPTTPAGPRTSPYVDGTTLHAHGRSVDLGHDHNVLIAGDTVLVGHWGRSHITWRALRGGRFVALPYLDDSVPALDPDGTRIVLATNPTPRTSRITVYDAKTDAELAHVDLSLPATCCDGGSVQQLSMDATGTVHWVEERASGASPEMAWRPGRAPVKVGTFTG